MLLRDGHYYIFVEEFIYRDKKGRIAVLEMDKKGNFKKVTTIIEKKYHLSYPFLIEDGTDLYMIPESSENNTIEM